jgi:hypothetical protein
MSISNERINVDGGDDIVGQTQQFDDRRDFASFGDRRLESRP